MRNMNNILPDWIIKQASLGPNVEVDTELNDDNAFWYFLTACCPLIFEKYAVILHPFWINHKAKREIESGIKLKEEDLKDSDYKSYTWNDFFSRFDFDFQVESAYKTKQQLERKLGKPEWPDYVWAPAEGDCEFADLKNVCNDIIQTNGDCDVNFFYCLLKTKDWENERLIQDKLSRFDTLYMDEELRDSPTAIYPDSKDWCIVSDYDLPMTFVGGSADLIDKIKKQTDIDIFEIQPRFGVKTPTHNNV
ncbi:hypothetical protein [Tenacibaculum singaporense]|uniref:hypothetical protein n=1 Tax=Tenacibaculum singaporense TaxID=2358479 RepID=UPI000F6848A0|nr:hypothetical protein [Tenacibaculum singaporense]RSC92944.1 hypothetical protein EI424_10890 [Tenacibaculum singaporense]